MEIVVNLKAVVFVFVLTSYMTELLSVIIQVDTFIVQKGIHTISDNTKITLFADKHTRSPFEKEQIESVLSFLQTSKNTHNYHLLVEQALVLYKLHASQGMLASGYEILCTLDNHIKKAQLPVKLDNIEVRYVTGLVNGILNYYHYHKDCGSYMADEINKTIDSITFQDLFDEFDTINKNLAQYYVGHVNKRISEMYTHYTEIANDRYEKLGRMIKHKDKNVFEYAKEEYDSRLSKKPSVAKESEKNIKALAKAIELTFIHLLDLNLLKAILTSTSQNILVFAGGDHTREVIKMLYWLQATNVYQMINSVNTSTCHTMTLLPITGKQVSQALYAELPKPNFMPTYARVVVGVSLVAGLAHWVYKKFKATDKTTEEESVSTEAEEVAA
jgi:hypothetical protein